MQAWGMNVKRCSNGQGGKFARMQAVRRDMSPTVQGLHREAINIMQDGNQQRTSSGKWIQRHKKVVPKSTCQNWVEN